MDLTDVMFLFNSSLEEVDPQSFWNLVSVRTKPVHLVKFLLEMTEKLACCPFQTINETEVGDVGGHGPNLMLCNIRLSMEMMELGNDCPCISFKLLDQLSSFVYLNAVTKNRIHKRLIFNE